MHKPISTAETPSTPGWHVTSTKGVTFGIYPSEADARAYVEAHLDPQNIEYTIHEVE